MEPTIQLRQVIREMIPISDKELDEFVQQLSFKNFRRNDVLAGTGRVPGEVFFINRGLIRVFLLDQNGVEHTIHFALENQFIADYSNFLLQQKALYSLQALEAVDVVIIPRSAIEWGYKNLTNGEKLGRLIAEYYFLYQDNRIKNNYIRSPRQRYDEITEIFPGIHNRAPQHMIASYLGITAIHLSRLKRGRKI